MKKLFNYAFLSAIALTGATMFTACSSSEDSTASTEEQNPNFNPVTNEVLTKFVFSVSTGNQATTRQSSSATQATTSETFRGITNAALFTYKLTGDPTGDGKHLPAATTADKYIDLGSPVASATISNTNSHRVLEMSLPINTNTMLFYGKAPEGTASSAEATKGYSAYDLYGHLDAYTLAGGTGDDAGKDISAANFELGKRMTAANKTKYEEIKKLLGGVLTCIINTKIANGDHVALSAGTYGVDVATTDYPAVVNWYDYANNNNTSPVETTHELYPLEKKLADVYNALTTIQQSTGELRAGYGTAILHTIQDAWSVINSVKCATPFSKGEAVAKKMAELIHNEINTYFDGTVPVSGDNKGGAVSDVTFKAVNAMMTAFNADTAWPTATHPTVSSIESEDLTKFPMAYSVPSGAAHYDWKSETKTFEYVTDYSTASVGGAGGFTVDSYFYPAELLYFGNSPLRVSGTEHKEPTYPNGVDNWKTDASWTTDWVKDSHVVSTTRSVAMRNNINYGSALLKTTVGYKTLTLKDNNHAIQKAKDSSLADSDEPDKEITVNATSFQLVGLVIGGQYKKVGWDFTPKTSDNSQGYVYDKAIPEGAEAIPGTVNTASTPNYTLLFDNYKAGDVAQDVVYVALELRNNTGQDFYGKHNLIRNGDSFYLIGKLDPANYTSATTPVALPWSNLSQKSNDHPLPPYNADGTSKQVVRVFMQDFMTTANFWFGENSLHEALLTVPDLRHSSLTLGLSVDMNWSTGITFSDVILGQ
ncbi:MAG: hypothetical protein II404_11275 [Prevotella sp.]|nr:hypothetical protein [Prevotella sp.]